MTESQRQKKAEILIGYCLREFCVYMQYFERAFCISFRENKRTYSAVELTGLSCHVEHGKDILEEIKYGH
jgi:hypothetical protein